MSAHDPKSLRTAPLATPTDLKSNAVKDISGALNILLADMFTLYLSDTSLPCSERLAP